MLYNFSLIAEDLWANLNLRPFIAQLVTYLEIFTLRLLKFRSDFLFTQGWEVGTEWSRKAWSCIWKASSQGIRMSMLVSVTRSYFMSVTSGAPRWSVSGPLLFVIYVNLITVEVTGWIFYMIKIVKQKLRAVERMENGLDNLLETTLPWNLSSTWQNV